MRMFISQYNEVFYAKNIKDLQRQIGGRCSKMYGTINGVDYHLGYVIGALWLDEVKRVLKKAV